MGIRFDLRTANWLAYVVDARQTPPQLDSPFFEREALRLFLNKLREGFYSSPWGEHRMHDLIFRALEELDRSGYGDNPVPHELLLQIRAYFSQRNWTALLIPSGREGGIDTALCSSDFLRRLVGIRADDPGLILQLEDEPRDIFSLTDVFPAFRTALARSTEWPGVLLWTLRGDSTFLPLPTASRYALEEAAHWIFSHLATSLGIDLELFTAQYLKEFPSAKRMPSDSVHLLQLSDVHIGCSEAGKRIPRVQQLVRNLYDELGDSARILPLVSGDLMDSPDEKHLDAVRSFLDFLTGLSDAQPLVVLGNHDVRKDGYLAERLRHAMQLPAVNGRLHWLDEQRIGLLCFNSVVGGRLARGFVGERQLLDMGNELDRNKNRRDYSLVGLLHHHPTPVDRPDWYAQAFYERVLGRGFEKTEELEDAQDFIGFAEGRRLAAILHGHKHIPRVDKTPASQIPIFGCGSTVGKVATTDGRPYMSMNVITIDTARRRLSGRLLAERVPGGGLTEDKRHEVLARAEIRPSL